MFFVWQLVMEVGTALKASIPATCCHDRRKVYKKRYKINKKHFHPKNY